MSGGVLVVGREPGVVAAVVAAVRGHGFAATGATRDTETAAVLAAGRASMLVIGAGVEQASRDFLRERARSRAVPVVEEPLGGRDVADYVRAEILPRLTTGRGETDSRGRPYRRGSSVPPADAQ